MKKIFYVFFLLLFTPILVNAEYKLDYNKEYGDYYGESFNSVVALEDGGSVAAGRVCSYDIDGIDLYGNCDALLVRYDKDGEIVWQNNYGYYYDDELYSVMETSDGNFIAVGYLSFPEEEENKEVRTYTASYSDYYAYIMKVDEDGNVLWENYYSSNSEYFNVVETTNGYAAVGYTDVINSCPNGVTSNCDYSSGLLSEYNVDGELINDQEYGADLYYQDIVFQEDMYYIVGYSSSYIEPFFLKMDYEGNILTDEENLFLEEYQGYVFQTIEEDSGNFVVLAYDYEYVGDSLLIRLNSEGQVLSILANRSNSVFQDVQVTSKYYYVAGFQYDDDYNTFAFVTVYDYNGTVIDEFTFTESESAYFGIDVLNNSIYASGLVLDSYESVENSFRSYDSNALLAKYSKVRKKYTITVLDSSYGSVSTVSTSLEDELVVIQVNPDDNYELVNLEILNADMEDITDQVSFNMENYSFIMPTQDIVIRATFDIENPQTGKTLSFITFALLVLVGISLYYFSHKKKIYKM